MIPLVGAAQHYAWGSDTAIPTAIGVPQDGTPWAELWWGTHPSGPTTATVGDGEPVPLHDLAGDLPFLVKLLAAARPLSLQTHPSADQAAAGFAAEERRAIPLDAPERVYRDPFGKPELLVAVTPFDALCGFRPVDEAAAELQDLGVGSVADRLRREGPTATVAWLLRERPDLHVAHPLVQGLAADHPGDPGAVVALLLNRIRLDPGEAVFLTAGSLHMYLHGVGLEVMGASDNVVRGGLTSKHIDVPELLRILDPAPRRATVLRPSATGDYDTETEVFAVRALGMPEQWRATGPEIVVRLAGGGATMAWYVPPGELVQWPGGLGCRVTTGSG